MQTRAWVLTLLSALIASCGDGAAGASHPRPALPKASDDVVYALRALTLDHQKMRLGERVAADGSEVAGAPETAALRKWQELAERATALGETELADDAILEVRALERRADDLLAGYLLNARDAYTSGDWPRCFGHLDQFDRTFPDTQASARCHAWRRLAQEVQAQHESASLRLAFGMSRSNWEANGDALSLENVEFMGEMGESLSFREPLGSRLIIRFTLDRVPEHCYLRLSHLPTMDNGFARTTINIALNQNPLVGDWALPTTESTFRSDAWEITDRVRAGLNTLEISLGFSALQVYWLRYVEIADRRLPWLALTEPPPD